MNLGICVNEARHKVCICDPSSLQYPEQADPQRQKVDYVARGLGMKGWAVTGLLGAVSIWGEQSFGMRQRWCLHKCGNILNKCHRVVLFQGVSVFL